MTSTQQEPEVVLGRIGTYIDTAVLTSEQRQRAWCLTTVRILFATYSLDSCQRLAQWLYDTPPPPRAKGNRGPKPAVSLQHFVEVWNRVSETTTAPRDAVCTELGISTRTYDRYRSQVIDPDHAGATS